MSRHGPDKAATIRSFFEQTLAAWPDIEIRVEHAVAEDDWVTGQSVVTANHAAVFAGVKPTRRKVETTFWDLHRFNEGGLIVETWNRGSPRLAAPGRLPSWRRPQLGRSPG